VGERLLGSLLDRAHILPPHLLAPLIAQEIAAIGGHDITIYLQDYEQLMLLPLAGDGLLVGDPAPIDSSLAGRAFAADHGYEHEEDDGVRLYVPVLDGSDRVGVLAFTLDRVDEDDRRLARRLAGLVADMIVTKGMYSDLFGAQLQWQLLPPLTMTTPRVALAGILEPAYDVGGDSFDYALNNHVLHVVMLDAMGHGLDAAMMATVAITAYRHARRGDVGLVDLYALMDTAMTSQFGPDQFATAQMAELDVDSGVFSWVNAGHPAPLLVRGRKVVAELGGPTTLPVGFGGDTPAVQRVRLQPADRVLLYTDGVTEERLAGGDQFGEELANLLGDTSEPS
jgi:serine phosphatase RsbU (regulator of sigma subunit)